ncbi:BON domain-containing protein [Singulisphaera acidiphila]|uniref:Putative phospholipid-binding protein n=1 Tax=Singulisphaera acidiphila (strain ATCC BAA-1392 / DSM 18658 / VKM B-2454 / MOB10) TaxID=886293 RepID=L0DAA2_SINAD|nr:BON domain-containing protein [Singulisphaera acidiphila]AGA26177.1 putative phospholipid-binding protein [Singulisphaera acidiphila DSM 18658]
MIRASAAALLSLALVTCPAFAQDGPLRRAGRALDATGKNIRSRVETDVARAQSAVQEREMLNRVMRRIEWDKQFVGSALRVESRPGGAIILRGSVTDATVKLRAVDLAQNTLGVTSVTDELAVVKEVRVIQANPAPIVIESIPSVGKEVRVIESAPAPIVIESTPAEPAEAKVNGKP